MEKNDIVLSDGLKDQVTEQCDGQDEEEEKKHFEIKEKEAQAVVAQESDGQ